MRYRWSGSKKNRVAYVVFAILACCIVAALARAIYIWTQPKGDGTMNITLTADGTTTETMEVTGLNMLPGATKEYSLDVTCSESGTYTLKFEFDETAESPLKEWVIVSFWVDGEEKASVSLSDAFDGRETEFRQYVETGAPTEVVIRYTMDENAGNEAMGASATFDLRLTAELA